MAAPSGGRLQAPPTTESSAMKTARLLLASALCAIALPAAARKPCDELRAEIDAKIRANGVPVYTLSIVDAVDAATAGGKIVGQCDGGTKRIVYVRGAALTTPSAETTESPAG